MNSHGGGFNKKHTHTYFIGQKPKDLESKFPKCVCVFVCAQEVKCYKVFKSALKKSRMQFSSAIGDEQFFFLPERKTKSSTPSTYFDSNLERFHILIELRDDSPQNRTIAKQTNPNQKQFKMRTTSIHLCAGMILMQLVINELCMHTRCKKWEEEKNANFDAN